MDSSKLKAAKAWASVRPDVTAVYEGFRHKGAGTKKHVLKETCIVFAVKKKRPLEEIAPGDLIPSHFEDSRTDVIEAEYQKLSFTDRRRPCEAGNSGGHHRITAGTIGAPVVRGTDPTILALTNNHVAANSNDAIPNDAFFQPGPLDGGAEPRWATLEEFVTINFDGGTPPPPVLPDCPMAMGFVQMVNLILKRFTTSSYQVFARRGEQAAQPVTQAQNLVDAALVRPVEASDFTPTIRQIGALAGIRDLVLGDIVQKVGRTTEHTVGTVVGINAQVNVNYGDSGTALFEEQVIIEGQSGDFSAGGDSGSAIVTPDMMLGALLFAGGGGQTIGNKISNVVALLGVRVP